MLTLQDQLEKFFRNIEELQKKVQEGKDIFDDLKDLQREKRKT